MISFGVIADIQYADKEASGSREYRNTLRNLASCIADLNGRKPAFTVQLGDFVDGDGADMPKVSALFGTLRMPIHHAIAPPAWYAT